MSAGTPKFVTGDDATALRVTLQSVNGVVIDPAGGETRLYATGFDNADKPGSVLSGDTRKSVLGFYGPGVVNPLGQLAVEFPAIGLLSSIGTGRRAQRYTYRIQHVDSAGNVWRQDPEGEFVVEAWVS